MTLLSGRDIKVSRVEDDIIASVINPETMEIIEKNDEKFIQEKQNYLVSPFELID